jgi:dolichol kinase
MDDELKRQAFHIVLGIATLSALLLFGRGFMIAAVFLTIITGSLLINARMLGKKIALVRWFERNFERPDAMFPGWGSACYATGALIALTFLNDIGAIAAIIFILGIGDGIATIIGKMGRIKLPYNKNKTLEGTMAFFFASLPAYYFVGPLVIPLAIAGALVESIDFKVDDNLMIPIVCTALVLVI